MTHSKKIYRDWPVITGSILGICLVIQMIPGAVEFLQFDRPAVLRGEIWRLFTAQLAHWSWNHFLWDAVVFAALGAICERWNPRMTASSLLAGLVLIPGGVLAGLPGIVLFRGLSGLDAALFILASVLVTRERGVRRWRFRWIIPAVAVGLLLAKVAFELVFRTHLFVSADSEFVTVPLAHMMGGLTGLSVPGAVRFAPPLKTSSGFRR